MTAGLFLGLLLLVGLSLWIAIREHRENVLKSRVIAATNCGVLVTDATLPHYPVIYVNPSFLSLTGYAEHDVVGQTTAILNGPATDRASIEKLAWALQDGRACRVSLRQYRKNGTSFWNEVTLSPIEDRTGRVRSVIWVMRDVSRLLQAETGVHKVPSPTFLCDLASEGMLVTTEFEVVYVNKTGLKILGAESAEQVIGSQYLDIVHLELREAVRLWIGQTVGSSQSTRRLETQLLRCDGQGVVVELSVAPLMWDGNESVLIRFSEISRQRQPETQSLHGRNRLGQGQTIADSENWGWTISEGAEIWSEEHYRVFGYEPGSVPPTYETFKKVLHPEDRDRVLTLVEETFSSDRPYDIECRIIQPSGDVRFVRCRGVLIQGSSDQPIRMSGTIEDITDYRLIAAMAEDRDLQFKTVMESVPNGMLMVRQDGTISLVNSSVERMSGYVREELLGRPMECLLSARDRDQQREARAACFTSIASDSTDISQEWHGLRKDGSEFPVKVCFHPVHLSKGRTILITMIDLTAREQAEQSLVDIEARFDLAVLAGRVGIFEYDHRTNTHHWSPMLREIYGVSAEESPSLERYLELVHPGDRERMHRAALCVPDTGREGLDTVEHRLVRPSGSIRHISLRTLTQFEGEGSMRRPMRTMGMVVDITDRVHSEMVVRVVKEIETMRTLTGGIAHELNNSLTAVLGFSELALALIPAESKAHRHLIQVIGAGRKAREVAYRIRRAIDHASTYSVSRPIEQAPSTLSIEVSDAVGPRG
ncbi:MAG: PAS domain S-box protein [Nitrospira sp.]|nr:PAS domain S-box protein [Nitrospira sp.]MDH4370750.1 PAS domain S-box protein [Nitrospira sp.]MDH5496933.1 PAS domain S-box protein [Nitrospira sp.]MDH5724153.1 PAS domain S-box protein [Nitrospira sp.]